MTSPKAPKRSGAAAGFVLCFALGFTTVALADVSFPGGTDEQCGNQTCASPYYSNADWEKTVMCCCRESGNNFKTCQKRIKWYTSNGTNRCYSQLSRGIVGPGCTPSANCGSAPAGDCGVLQSD